jgi:glycosyltransferase involved in cell wall biosynthesis
MASGARAGLRAIESVGITAKAVDLRWSHLSAGLPESVEVWLQSLEARPLGEANRRVFVTFAIPNLCHPRPDRGRWSVARTMYETASLPPEWVPMLNRLEALWLSSSCCVDTFRQSGVTTPSIAIPEALEMETLAELISSWARQGPQGAPPRPFVFFTMFDWSLRKGWDVLVRAFVEEFASEGEASPVELWIKTYSSARIPGTQIIEILRQAVIAATPPGRKPPTIKVLPDVLGTDMLSKVWRGAHAFVLASRGEGWGRPLTDALAVGCPVVATTFGGQSAFLDEAVAEIVDYTLQPVPPPAIHENPIVKGLSWGEPDPGSLRSALRRVFADYPGALAKAANGQRRILQRCHPVTVGMQYREALHRLVDPVPPVHWEGDFFVQSSLARVNREVVRRLLPSVLPQPSDIDPTLLRTRPDWEPQLRAHAHQVGRQPPRLTIRHHFPMDETPTGTPLVYVQPWEYTRAPRRWIEHWNRTAREVWAPSEFTIRSYRESGLTVPAFCLPNGVDTRRYVSDGPTLPLPTQKAFKFLYVGGTIWRKGVDLAVNAFLNAFRQTDDVALVVKDFGRTTFYRDQNLFTQIQQLLGKGEGPEIVLVEADLSDEDLPKLYRACDCVMAPYRGEGFNLPLLEAQACGRATIASRWGPALEFCNEATSWFIDGTPIPVTIPFGPLQCVEMPSVFEPKIDHLIALLRQAAADSEGLRRRGLAGRQNALTYDWDRISAGYADRIAAITSSP